MPSILITGASTGFGRNVALALAQAGWDVFATMRDPAKGDGLVADAQSSGCGARLALLPLDVTDADSVAQAATEVLAQTGGTLDVLFANAGYSALGAFEDLSDADCRGQMETNFFGVLATARAVIPTMRAAGRGRIVVVSSNAVNTPHPMLSMYAASKWALEGWAEALALELAPFGVGVKVVQPGAHRTPFAQNVVPVIPAGSAYQPWLDQAMPGVSNLDRWGNDANGATDAIVGVITETDAPFLTRVGEDAATFGALKGMVPFEVRAWAVRAITGLPAANAFVGKDVPAPDSGVLADVATRVGQAAASDQSGIAALAQSLMTRTR